MGRIADRLPVFTSNAPDIEFDLTPTQCQGLSHVLGASLSDEVVFGMLPICRRYLHYRRTEIGAGKKSDAMESWGEARSRISKFIDIAEGTYPPRSDAGEVVTNAIFDGLARVSIQLTERDVEPAGLDASLSKGSLPLKGMQLNLTTDLMMRLAGAFRIAVDHADRELKNLGEGFRPGQAFTSWLMDMRDWAKANNLPHGAASKGVGELTPFPKFLYCLNGFFPTELRESVASDEAMNMRLSRALYGANTS
jgi:hypothetical protein